ncbi:hypothetical protein NE237_014974 [Protea cynaroides]|uniref:Uncharacterized protein n=1 Tax=Protea cynaroides TaxID=273540 RepID=A0A9Q0KCZ8_9MAGN|nr:hypothetical protein NE237_014974 [Protea cynaroides]
MPRRSPRSTGLGSSELDMALVLWPSYHAKEVSSVIYGHHFLLVTWLGRSSRVAALRKSPQSHLVILSCRGLPSQQISSESDFSGFIIRLIQFSVWLNRFSTPALFQPCHSDPSRRRHGQGNRKLCWL